MWRHIFQRFQTCLGLFAIPFALSLGVSATASADTPMTAGVVAGKMNSQQKYAYLAGIVEGLAYARFIKDNKREDGMKCIYEWFYGAGADDSVRTTTKAYEAFEKYPDYPPGVIVWTLLKKQCGE